MPEAVSLLALTPCAIRKRTTVLARAVESSQLLGNSLLWIGTLSVLPSTEIGCVSSTFSSCGDLRQQPVGAAFERRLAGGEQQIVGQHPDHQAARFDRRLHALGEAVRGGVGVELVLDVRELRRLVLGGGLFERCAAALAELLVALLAVVALAPCKGCSAGWRSLRS